MPVNIENINAIIFQFETNVNNYASTSGSTTSPDVRKNIQHIRSWVDEQSKDSNDESRNQSIEDIGNAIETSINAIESLRSGDPIEVMGGCLSIVGSVAAVVGGPYGAAAGAICGILGAVLSINTPNKPDLATVFIQKVHVELQKFNQELKVERFGGLQSRVRNMAMQLGTLRSKKDSELPPDRSLYETDFVQFIGEVSANITKGLSMSSESEEEDLSICLASMVMYCNAQTSLLLLLANVMSTFQATGRETAFIKNLLNAQKQDAIQKLGFLSDEKNLSPGTAFASGGGQLAMILHLRRSTDSYAIVEEFRKGLGMTKMPELDTIRTKVFDAAFSRPKDVTCKYAQPQTRGDNHYFQFINHSHCHVQVVCGGNTGDNVNGLDIKRHVWTYESYEHVATKSTWTFSTGGYFIIYFDGQHRPFDQNLFEGVNFKVFEFALSNPFLGFRKTNILEKTNNLLSVTGQDCWNQMKEISSPEITFAHKGKYYLVQGGYTGTVYIKGVIDYPGRNECRTWRFVLQEYDPIDGVEKACAIM